MVPFVAVFILIADYLTKAQKEFLLAACVGAYVYFLYLYYRMIVEVKAREPETRSLLLAVYGLFPVFAAHKRAVPESRKRVAALVCILIGFALFVVSSDVIFR